MSTVKDSDYMDAPTKILTDAFTTNMLGLQLRELLLKVRRTREAQVDLIEFSLRKLKTIIEDIPSQQGLPILTAQENISRKHGISIPFPESGPNPSAKYALAYDKPTNINVVGSYARKTGIRVGRRVVVDLAVTMPSHLFQEKDYVHYRYFHKRAYYLACLAAGIQRSGYDEFSVKFGLQNDNHLQPILLIEPGLEKSAISDAKFQIRILLAAPENLFPITKTLPNKNCIRAKEVDSSQFEHGNKTTPLYNATLRSECSSLAYLKFLHQTSISLDAFGDACVLGGVWLQKRGLAATLTGGGFGQFEWACLVALLLKSGGIRGRPVLFKGYNSYQIFKAVLQFLATTDLVMHPLVIQYEDLKLSGHDWPVLFDGARGLNILFKMSAWSYYLLKHEASMTLQALNEPLADGFDSSFIPGINSPLYRFDYVLRLPLLTSWQPNFKTLDSKDRTFQFCQEMYDVLKKGLGDRAKLVTLQYSLHSIWPLTSSRPTEERNPFVLVALLLNAEQSTRSVDRGPPAEEKASADAFRDFWGEKAELRRFKDGSIIESLVWSITESARSIIDQIILYVTQRHAGHKIAEDAVILGSTFRDILSSREQDTPNPTKPFQTTVAAYEAFEKDLRGLEGLPLQVRQVSTTSPDLRSASIEPPNYSSKTRGFRTINVYVQFEGSGRWPDVLTAVQRTKSAFLLKIGDLFEQSSTNIKTALGLENEKYGLLNQSFLDVMYAGSNTGTTYRIRIHHEREMSMLKVLLKDKSGDIASRTEITMAIATYKRDFIQGPLHTQAVRTLSTRYPFLSPSMRLMKKWRDSHLLSHHISDELIELLTVRTFVQPHPWEAPASLTTGFLRTLNFASKWDWQTEPLIVDLTHEMSAKDIEGIHLQFQAWRKIDPVMNRIAMFAASNMDPDGITWTEQGPSKVVAARFSSLAKAACDRVKDQALDLQAGTLFAASTADYDFIIHLNPNFTSRRQGESEEKHKFKNLELQASESSVSHSGYDPINAFLDEIRALYGSNILFFHNAHETLLIAGIWNPRTGPREWKVNMTYSTKPVQQSGDGEPMISINQTATLHDIARLGGDMVLKVEINRQS